jgi:starch-binding outer membrane protein, SusD/RagB family
MIHNKMKNGLKFSAVMLGIVFCSCSLDIKETDSLITEGGSSVFNGVENPAASVDNLYNSLASGDPSQMNTQEELYALSEVTTDEQVVPTRGTDWGDNGVWRTLHTHTWGPTHRDVVNLWNNKNGAVLRATEIIDPLSTKSTGEHIAHAKFMRAYNMWLVMDAYGQVPFRNPADGPDVTPKVMTRQEAYDFIVKDLTEAIEALPASTPTAANKSRAVKATARFLLAKVKLNAKVYKGAYGANDLQDVINLVNAIQADGYALVGNYFSIFRGPTYTNTDVIWALPTESSTKMWNSLHYSQGEFIPNIPNASVNTGGGWNGFTTIAEFYDKFEGPTNTNAIGSGQEERRGYTHTLATTNADNEGFGYGFQLGKMYGWREGKAVELKDRAGNALAFTKELPGLVGNNDVTGIRLLKYSPANGSYTLGIVVFRFADAHLMRAEAMLRSGNAGNALVQVNQLRALRQNTSPLPSLNEQVLLDERGRELYLESVRRNDMIRFGVFKNARGQFKEAGDGHTDLFPIPASALLSNPSLVQNPGY